VEELLLFVLALTLVGSPIVCVVMTVRLSRRLTDAESLAQEQRQALELLRDKFELRGERATGVSTAPAIAPSQAAVETPSPITAPGITAPGMTAPAVSKPARSATAPAIFAPPVHKPAPSTKPQLDLESFLGGRVLLVAGVIAVLFALGFFLKIAMDRGWIGPAARVSVGLGCGIVALLAGDRLAKRLGGFGHAVMGAGLGALYISIWFAAARYQLLGQTSGFIATAAVTILGVTLALWRDAPLLAWLGFLGGYLGPAILGQDKDALEGLTGWLLLLHTGVFAVLCRRAITGLEILPLVASAVYFAAWSARFWGADRAGPAALCLGALFGAQLLLSWVPQMLAKSAFPPLASASSGLAGLAMIGFGQTLFFEDHRLALGAAVAVLGSVYAAVGWAQTKRRGAREPDSETLTAFALACLAIALPILLDGRGLSPAWAFAGLAAIAAGLRLPSTAFTLGGAVMIVLALTRALLHHPLLHDAPFTAFVNGPFVAAAAPGIAGILAARLFRRAGDSWRGPALFMATAGSWHLSAILAAEAYEAVIFGHISDSPSTELQWARCAMAVTLALYASAWAWRTGRSHDGLDHLPLGPVAVALATAVGTLTATRTQPFVSFGNVFFGTALAVTAATFAVARGSQGPWRKGAALTGVVALLTFTTLEIDVWGQHTRPGDLDASSQRFIAQVATSAFWALYAATLVGIGFWKQQQPLRWLGLGLFGITATKVFVSDTARLDPAYRVGSFLALGVLLVAASYLYNRVNTESTS
jgi:uncharacterized membrane protein